MTVRTRSLIPLLALALGVMVAVPASQTGPTLLRKCCPAHQQLSPSLDTCVAWTGVEEAGEPVDPDTEWESAGPLRRRIGEGFPWWVNAKTPLYDADTGKLTKRPFLRGQEESAALHYGPYAPCLRRRAKYFTWDSNERYKLLNNGTLLLRTDESEQPNLPIPPDSFCVDRVDLPGPEDNHIFLTCPCEQTLCISKCCARYLELKVTVLRKLLKPDCQMRVSEPMWTPEFYHNETANVTVSDVQYILLDAASPKCEPSSELVVLNGDADREPNAMRVFADGSASMHGYGHGVPYPPSEWCADTSVVDGRLRAVNAMLCVRKEANRVSVVSSLLYGSLFVLSSLCLAATLLVYALLPDLRQSAHCKALLSHVAALLAGSLTLASAQLGGPVSTRNGCYVLAFTIQYFMLAAFFWLNTICFDVAWTFREILPPKASSAHERRKFLWYSAYAWGCPAVISAVTAVMDFAEGIPKSLVKPNIGLRDCWFYKMPALFAYFYGPLAALLLVNVALYAHTALQLVRVRRQTALVDAAGAGGDSARSALASPRERAILHLKLFLLMGITWVMECVSVAVGQDDAYWYVPDAVNILRGVFVFVLLCCKRDVWRRLRARLGALGCWPDGGGSGGGGSGDAGRQPGAGRSNGFLGPAATEIQQQPRRDTGVTAVTFCDATSKTIRASVDTVVPDVR